MGDGNLRYIEIQARMTLKKMQPGIVRKEVLDIVTDLLGQQQEAAPAAVGRVLQTVGFDWVFQRLRDTPCASAGCSDGMLVQPGAHSVSCFIEEFDAWTGGTRFE